MPEEARAGLDQRPSPEALLAEVGREGSGRLKIFLGAAPGVGKTYEMLTSARRRQLEGIDIVVGIVETHGRRETAALLTDLEILPRRPPPTVWCTVATANSRYIERCSREPGGAAMFCGDDYDAAQASSLLLRVSIPR